MKDVPLERLVRLVACGTGERFIFSPTRLKQANVTVVAPRPVSRDELMPLLDSALAQNKLSRDKRGAYHVIEQRAQAPSKRRSSKGR
jgi:type II secretory pathway component GspD/PulD (secretin)